DQALGPVGRLSGQPAGEALQAHRGVVAAVVLWVAHEREHTLEMTTLACSTINDIVGITNVEVTNERRGGMAGETTFTPQVLGETEKALNAILLRELGEVGLTEDQWIV